MSMRAVAERVTPNSSWELSLGMMMALLLHFIIFLLAVFGLPFVETPPPPIEESIPVDLVPLGDTTAAPPPKQQEAKPVEKPPEPPKPEPPKEEAKAEPPPPKPAPPPEPVKTEAPPPPPPPPVKVEAPPLPAPKPEPPKEEPKPKPPDQLAEVKPQKKPPPPPDDMESLLKTIDKMKKQPQPDAPKAKEPPKPQQEDLKSLEKAIASLQSQPEPQPEPTQSTSTMKANQISLQPTASETDFVRAQIERHWNFEIGARDAANLIVQVHVLLQPDGTVTSAQIVPDSRYDTDSFYRSAADTARRAVLAASPLQLPPNSYEKFKDFTFRFDPRNALQ